ncbi:MAG TPA: DegT/DnrJ/EryC1/StrS family aminotransferase [Dehalococcoidia bacterium]|nr:DegT/DnrJ/EryC1/StrS family aminotransferase [Dehalococcoidia bacterium]
MTSHQSPITIRLAQPIIEDEERAAVLEALESGQLAQGPRVAAFEHAFAEYVGVRHAVAVSSGTAALHLALLAHGVGPGDEVIVPAFSFAATANTVLHCGARPVLVDVREADFGIDVAQIEAAITPRTKAIVPVHLYGQMCDVAAVREICARRGVALIEDAAQAVGATAGEVRAGATGTGCFSFYATKNLQTGEGGMVTTDDAAVADRVRLLRSQGERTRYVTEEAGYNYRMTEIAAALGLAQLPKLDARTQARRANAARLNELLAGNARVVTPREVAGRCHVWHQYTVRVPAGREARDRLQAGLRERGIEAAVFYPTPIHRQPLYERLGYGGVSLPVAERLAGEVLSLPVHPALTAADVETVTAAVVEELAGG